MAAPDPHNPEPSLPLDVESGGRGDAYVVVARRYRPQTFDELIGQEHVARALKGAIETNRVGHAYLFTGARGVGKTSAARILAKALNCEHGPTPTPCNRCDMCASISAGSDVDVLEIDGASNRGIDEIRQLRQNVNIRPSRARFKIYIIDEVHMLTREAFNALLKTLEEPPEHVKFIFCTTEPAKIPITILSRCQRFDFAGIGQQSIVARLAQIVEAEGRTADPEALAILARRASGSMRDSQSLLEQLLAFGDATITAADVHAMLGTAGEARLTAMTNHLTERDPAAAIAELDAALAQGVEVGQLLEQLLGYFRDILVTAVGGTAELLLHASPAAQPQLAEAGRQLGTETILAIMQILDHTLSRLRYSTQARTLAEIALVRIAQLENLDDLAALIEAVRTGAPVASQPAGGAATSAPAAGSTAAAKKKGEPLNGTLAEVAIDGPHAGGTPATARRAGPVAELSDETVEVVWKEALANVSEMLAEHASLAESVRLAAPDRLAVTFRAKYTSCKAFCERPERLARLEAALAEVAGRPVSVEFALADDEPAEGGPPPAPVSPRQRMAERAEHPLVRRATELFDARLLRVEEPKE